MIRRICILICLVFSGISSVQAAGKLLVVGGALKADNQAVYDAFINAMPSPKTGVIAVVPVASGAPVESFDFFKKNLIRYGVAEERIKLVRLAVRDDRSTPMYNEETWAGNARKKNEIEKINQAEAIWFTGGDQLRIVQTLLTKKGQDSKMLTALRQRLKDGAVIGGTSAGAAMMSSPMILSGEPMTSLLYGIDPKQENALRITAGLGFFPYGMVDQHFDARARLGRLTRALHYLSPESRLGFGIDENTGLLVDLTNHNLQIIGAGNVTVIDARDAEFGEKNKPLSVKGAGLSVYAHQDRIDLASGKITIASHRKATDKDGYNDHQPASGGGMVFPAQRLADMLGEDLVDNKIVQELERISFTMHGETAMSYRFYQTPDTRSFWGRDEKDQAGYSHISVGFDVMPIKIELKK